jgi:hypothetical protein
MARRLRLGSASGPKMLGWALAAVLVAALALTGRLLYGGDSGSRPPTSPAPTTANTQAPYRIGNKVECPPNWPVLAMANHTSYPAGHPAKPPSTATAVACYHTAAQAASAGYAPAPLPPGVLEVGGVYLTRTGRGFRARCQQVADRLGFAIPCPGLLPTPPPGVPPPRLCEEQSMCRRGQLLLFTQEAFVVPFGYVGAPGGYGGLSVVATPARGTAGPSELRCQNERQIATLTVQGIWGVLTTCSDDPQGSSFGGSVLLRWSQRGTLVAVSVLGHSDVNPRLVVALGNHLLLVQPRHPARAIGPARRSPPNAA